MRKTGAVRGAAVAARGSSYRKRKEDLRKRPRISMGQKLLVASLLVNPNLTHAQIAQALGCSKNLVDRTSQEIDACVTKQEIEQLYRGFYARLLEKELPIAERARLVARIAQNPLEQGATRLKSIVYVDRVVGIEPLPGYERREGPPPQPPGPFFILPPGTHVQVHSSVPRQQIGDAQKPIDVTVESNDDKDGD